VILSLYMHLQGDLFNNSNAWSSKASTPKMPSFEPVAKRPRHANFLARSLMIVTKGAKDVTRTVTIVALASPARLVFCSALGVASSLRAIPRNHPDV
jgi:hypothetical protein